MATFTDVGITNDLLTSTLQEMRGPAVDSLFLRNAFLDHARKSDAIIKVPGSNQIIRPLAVTEHSSITQLGQSGFDPINTTVSDVLQPAVYSWSNFVAPIAISRAEELANRGEYAVVNLLKTRLESVLGLLNREVEKQILAGTSSVLTALNTLNGGSGTPGTNNGFLYYGATATNGGTVGGLARSVSEGLQNVFVDGTSVTTIEALTDAWLQAHERSISGKIGLILAGATAFKNYREELTAIERFTQKDALDAGRMELMFHDAAVAYSSRMTVSDMFFGVDFSGIKLAIDPDADFYFTDFRDADQQLARQAFCHVRMQLIADHLASSFVVDNAV